jgi:hypothetical protein
VLRGEDVGGGKGHERNDKSTGKGKNNDKIKIK